MRNACGSTTSRMRWNGDSARAQAASPWPSATAWIEPRTISAMWLDGVDDEREADGEQLRADTVAARDHPLVEDGERELRHHRAPTRARAPPTSAAPPRAGCGRARRCGRRCARRHRTTSRADHGGRDQARQQGQSAVLDPRERHAPVGEDDEVERRPRLLDSREGDQRQPAVGEDHDHQQRDVADGLDEEAGHRPHEEVAGQAARCRPGCRGSWPPRSRTTPAGWCCRGR